MGKDVKASMTNRVYLSVQKGVDACYIISRVWDEMIFQQQLVLHHGASIIAVKVCG